MKFKIVLLSLLVIQLQISLAFVRLRGSNVFVKHSLLGPKLAIVGQVPQINDVDVMEDMRRNSLSTLEILEALEELIGAEQPLPVTNTRGDAFLLINDFFSLFELKMIFQSKDVTISKF